MIPLWQSAAEGSYRGHASPLQGTEYRPRRPPLLRADPVRNDTVGNLSHLEEWMIDGPRAMLAGRRGRPRRRFRSSARFRMGTSPRCSECCVSSIRAADLPRALPRAGPGGGDDRPAAARTVLETVDDAAGGADQLGEELQLGGGHRGRAALSDGLAVERQERVEKALARRHLHGEGFVLYDLSSSYLEGATVASGDRLLARWQAVEAADQLRAVLRPEGQPI